MDEIIRRYKRDLAIRGYSERTCSAYLYYLQDFLKFTNSLAQPPEKDQIKDYLYHLISERKLADATVRQASASLKFLCTQTFNIQWQSGVGSITGDAAEKVLEFTARCRRRSI